MEKENEFSGAVVESDMQRMMKFYQDQASEDRRLAMANAEEDRRKANERFFGERCENRKGIC